MSCDHAFDAEYIYPSDAIVRELYDVDGTIGVRLVLPCPDCDAPLELTAPVEQIEETAVELPLDSAENRYD